MNCFTMTVHTVLEAVSALLHAGDTPFYLLLTCTSILFSVLIIFRRRKGQTEESLHRWVAVSATSLDPIVACQSSPQTLKSSPTQLQNKQITERNSTIHRKNGPQYQHTEFFPSNGYHEGNRDRAINGELHCSKNLESIPHWSNETATDRHILGPNSCELLDKIITDSSRSFELSQCSNTDVTHMNELTPCTVTDVSRTDELTPCTVTDVSRTDELTPCTVTDVSRTDELTPCTVTDVSRTEELTPCTVTDVSRTEELTPCTVTDVSRTDELTPCTVTDVSRTDELTPCTVTDVSRTEELTPCTVTDVPYMDELSRRAIIDTAHTDELSRSFSSNMDKLFQGANTNASHKEELCQILVIDTSQTDDLPQRSVSDFSQTDELSQRAITDASHRSELSLEFIRDNSHSGEPFQPATTDMSTLGELFQKVVTDTFHSSELYQRASTDTSHSGELFQPATTDTFHSGELFLPSTTDRSHSGELFQPATTDSHQLTHREDSSYNYAQHGSLPSTRSWCCSQHISKVYCQSTDKDHEREITHAFTDHNKGNECKKDNSFYNKAKACTAKPEPMDTVLTCNQDSQPLWQQLSLDSHQLPRSHARVRSSSISNMVHTRDKPAREQRIRRHGCMWQPDMVKCTVTSCKMKAASKDSGIYSPTNSDPTSKLYTSSHIHCTDQFPDSSCTCMFKTADTRTNPVFPQEIPNQQEPESSELPGGTYVTFVHSFPITRSRYKELRYSSERRASHSHRKMSSSVCRHLEESNLQNYATPAHTSLRNSYSQEPTCVQTSCAVESNSLTDQSIPLHPDRIRSHVSHSNEPVLYRNPKQRHSNRIFRAKLIEGQDLSDSSPSVDFPSNIVPGIFQRHPPDLPETALNRHDLGTLQPASIDTSTSPNPQVQLRRKRWGKSYCVPAERSQSMQLDFMSRPLSLAMPVISQSNDSLSRRKQITLSDMEQHLSRHTKGIFRRKVSVNNMLTWTKDPIQKPMIRSKDKSTRKEACELFKNTYMGDRKGKQTQMLVGLEVVTRGWSMPSLRDEIYVQLMRQTTDNKKGDSLKSGWELLAVCLYFFPPSPKFHPFLESYISKNQESVSNNESIPPLEMSAHCLRRLKRAQKMGMKTAVHKPTLEELEHAKATICCPTMFGNMLEDIMLLQRDKYPDRQLPWIQTVLSEEILRLHGAQTEGIFRVSGDIDEVNNMKSQCDKWILPIDCTDPHIPASLLKLWYRELFEPLIPAQFYQACVDNFSNPEAAIAIVYQLPRLNHLVLCYLIRFLQLFASPGNVAFTKMDVNNLAMVMAPSCLRYESEDLLTIYEHVQKEMGFIRTLIRYLDTSFMEGIV